MNTNGEILIAGLLKRGYTENAAKNVSTAYLNLGVVFISPEQAKDCKNTFRCFRRNKK